MKKRSAFTLIELLVVVAVIAILVAVLLPALNGARREGQSIAALQNARSMATASLAYTADGGFSWSGTAGGLGTFPPSYLYATGQDGNGLTDPTTIDIRFQRETHPSPSAGYVSWTYYLFNGEFVQEDAFTSPLVLNGGAPRTNPGPDVDDWEDNQVNDAGQGPPAGVTDRQVPRLAFAPNGLIMGRNKFSPFLTTPRSNRLVKVTDVGQPDQTILFSEFAEREGWASVMTGTGSGRVSKSHRPITPVIAFSASDEFRADPDSDVEQFVYWNPDTLIPWDEVGAGAIENGSDVVGRHHPSERTAFVHLDGSGERNTVENSIRDFRWGRRYYSITGNNLIDDDEFAQ